MTDAPHSARLTLGDPIAPVTPRLFGGFVEHLGRHIHDGIFEPGHPTADEHGFRRDVVDLVRELGVTTIRYPGGNFVSGYRWEDGVGPVEERPTRLDLAWRSTETNRIGLQEFQQWLDLVGGEHTELMLALNLGTRGLSEALELLEYTNHPRGTTLSDRRRAHGREAPYDVRMWCLGNEIDGPWQLGHRSADDYGKLAAMTARAMKTFDPALELVVCGSSGHGMPTFGEWERTVLTHTQGLVDFVSCHAYYEDRGDLASFLASGVDMDGFIREVGQIIDEVAPGVAISFDEWNVWYMSRHEARERPDGWPVAPRLLEDVYTVADAVVVGGLLITLLRNADRVRSASLAQLVNVIGPIMTEPDGPAWRQTTFHPFATTARLARGSVRGVTVSGPSVVTKEYGEVPAVDAVATRDGDATAVFLVNRSTSEAIEVDLSGVDGDLVAETLADSDHTAVNTAEHPDRVALRPLPVVDGRVTLPPVSWSVVHTR